MSGSTRRIRQLAVLFGLGLGMVVLHLANVMVVEHEAWLSRSYKNRWAFRDVPARRGSLQDRQGRWLAQDRPCSALELHYWAFRRYHPVGAAVEGCHLALKQGSYENPTKAFWLLLSLGVDRLRKEVAGRERARDVRFYLSSLLSALTNASHFQIGSRLRKAAADGSRESVWQVLGLDPRELLDLFEARLAELEDLSRRLPDAGPRHRDLWETLEESRRDRQDWLWLEERCRLDEVVAEFPTSPSHLERAHLPAGPLEKVDGNEGKKAKRHSPPEQRLVRIHDQLPFELALYLVSIRERHPGLVVHPWVTRVRNTLPGRTDLASLEPIVGRVVRAFWRKDKEDQDEKLLQQQLDRMSVELEELPEGNAELSEHLRQEVRKRAEKAVTSLLKSRGRVGLSGAEEDLDLELRGGPGLRFVERSRRVRERRLLGSFDVTPGIDRRLTFDLRLQALLEQALDEALAGLDPEQQAAMAVIDMHGDVLAVASRPLDGGLPTAVTWRSAGDIGSVGKPFVLLEHLDAMRHGRPHKPHHDYRECVGTYSRRPRLGCDHSHMADARDPVKALGESCNFFFYQAAEGLEEKGVLAAYQRFGLVPGERHQEKVPGLWWKHRVRQTKDLPQRLAIGYRIEANVLSIARAYAGLATGSLPELSFVLDEYRQDPVDLGLHPQDLETVRDGMDCCVREGTAARETGLSELGVLAKTGTATVGKPTSKINNAWLAGYLTRERPTLAFAAVVYSVRGYGAAWAGPMVTRFLKKLHEDPELREAYL